MGHMVVWLAVTSHTLLPSQSGQPELCLVLCFLCTAVDMLAVSGQCLGTQRQ